jgi:hypothetical protein
MSTDITLPSASQNVTVVGSKVVSVHNMKTYDRMDVTLHLFLTSGCDEWQWQAPE